MSLTMKELWGSSHISAGHAAYLESLYEIFINNPEDLSKEWFDFLKKNHKIKKAPSTWRLFLYSR